MIYLMDTKLSNNLDIKTALTKIYGVNTFLSVKICKKLGFALNFKVKKMSSHQNQKLVQFFENSNFVLGYSLKQQLTIINKQQVDNKIKMTKKVSKMVLWTNKKKVS